MHIYRAHYIQGCGLRLTVNGWNGVAKSDHKGESSLERTVVCSSDRFFDNLSTSYSDNDFH